MANGIRTGDLRGFNKGRSSKFREGSRIRQTPVKAGGHIGWNVVEITKKKMKTKVRKPLMIKTDQHLKYIQTHWYGKIVIFKM